MKTLTKYLLLLLFAFTVTKCVTPAPVAAPVARVIEKERIVNKPFDAVWQSAVEYFATHNTPIKNLDKGSGLISTEYSLSMGEASRYMDCGSGTTTFSGMTELANHSGNFNVIIKKIDDTKTKISINVFFGCTVNKYRYASLFSTQYILESSSRINCASIGVLESEVLNYLEAAN